MRNRRLYINLIAILALVMVTFGNISAVAQAGDGKDELKADPRLLQMAAENPNATFRVIVQKDAKKKDSQDRQVENEVGKGHGKLRNQLDFMVSFSAELTGKEITRLAKHPRVRWITADAPMTLAGTAGMDTVLDGFPSVSFSQNSGTKNWSNNWTEGDRRGDAAMSTADVGVFKVAQSTRCADGTAYCLQVDPGVAGGYVYREANLTNAAIATLSLFRNNRLNEVGRDRGEVTLDISANGGASWTTLRSYSNSSYTGSTVDTFDITGFASEKTRIRFYIKDTQLSSRFIFFDNIQIQFAIASAYRGAVGAQSLSQETGLDGSGITVAVLDSGIEEKHPDFMPGNTSRVIASVSFGDSGNQKDLYGHGTHVAGIVGGSGSASAGKYIGVAPGVNLINLKVSDKDGMTYESSILNALQWIYDNRDAYNIRVVNISMNSTVDQSYNISPLDAAVEILWFNGVVVVVSAGNNGTAAGPVTLYPPANDPFVITVGATEDKGTSSLADDTMAVFSAYGTTSDGFAKPDLVAPGRNLVAPLSDKASTVYNAHPLYRVGDYYFRMSGTSMSAPVVSGAVALLLQDEPDLNPDQVKYRLMTTAQQSNWTFDSTQAGAGYLDVYSAVSGTTTETANTGITVSQMLSSGTDPVTWDSVGWNSVGWNSVGWNSVGWNSVGWNSVGWNASVWDD